MKVSIQGAATQSFTEENKTVGGLLVSMAATTVADITIALMEAVQINVVLYRNSSSINIASGNLFALGVANNPSSYEGLAIGSTKNFIIRFGGVVNLKQGDRLQVTVTVGTTATGLVTTVASEYAVGVEWYTPQMLVYPIDKTRTNVSLQLGDNVNCVSFINTSTAFVVTQAVLHSDIWECNYNTTEFYAQLAEQWERTPEYYAWHLYSGAEMDNVTLDATINTGATGNNYIVSFAGIRTAQAIERAERLTNKIAVRMQDKFTVKKAA